jgi:hypothetical protein
MYFMTIRKILQPFGIIHGRLVKVAVILYIFPVLVCLDQEKSSNPGLLYVAHMFMTTGQFLVSFKRRANGCSCFTLDEDASEVIYMYRRVHVGHISQLFVLSALPEQITC